MDVGFNIIISSLLLWYTDLPNKPLPVVNVHEKPAYVDRCRYDLHSSEEFRQQYLLTSEKSVSAIDNTTNIQPLDCAVQGKLYCWNLLSVYSS